MRKLTLLSIVLISLVSCSGNPEVIYDLSESSYQLVNEDSVQVNFPADFQGSYVVMGFIYTHCPDICSLITQNLIQIQQRLNNPEDVEMVAVSFDPVRDTPSKLKKYADTFGVDNNERMHFLTGDSTNVFALMKQVKVRSQVSFTQEREDKEDLYFLNHSDKIIVMDKKGRVIIEYGGSQPMIPNLVIEDLNALR